MIVNSKWYQEDMRQAANEAARLYDVARRRAWLGRLSSALTGRSPRLMPLSAIQAAGQVRGSHYAGTRAVPLDQIRGSEGRSDEFDRNFQPLQTRTRDRWLSIALAHALGKSLAPVELVQVGEIYFVRDGHHRISVAKALGQTHIDAQVTVYTVEKHLANASPMEDVAREPIHG